MTSVSGRKDRRIIASRMPYCVAKSFLPLSLVCSSSSLPKTVSALSIVLGSLSKYRNVTALRSTSRKRLLSLQPYERKRMNSETKSIPIGPLLLSKSLRSRDPLRKMANLLQITHDTNSSILKSESERTPESTMFMTTCISTLEAHLNELKNCWNSDGLPT